MKNGVKIGLLLASLGALVYFARKFYAKGGVGGLPPVDVMREELWQSFVSKYPETAGLKDVYLKGDAFNNIDFMIAWYKAKKAGKSTFEHNSRTWRTDDGMGV